MERNIAIDITKGICILLVVIGHYTPANAPESYKDFVDFIYTFHMPVFMWASGFLYIYAFKPMDYGSHIRKKSQRLLLPYLIVSILIVSIKMLSEGSLSVEHPTTASDFMRIFYLPAAGYFLWYVWALFIIFLIAPLFITPKAQVWLFIGSLVVSLLPISWPQAFSIDQAVRFLPYFALGMCCASAVMEDRPPLRLSQPTLLIISTIALGISITIFCFEPVGKVAAQPIMALLGLITITSFAVAASHWSRHLSWFLAIADSTFIIYLFHTTFQGFTKASLEKISPDMPFAFNVVFVFLIGWIGPLALHHLILKRNRVTRYIFSIKTK